MHRPWYQSFYGCRPQHGASANYQGKLANLMVFDKVLTQEEIVAIGASLSNPAPPEDRASVMALGAPLFDDTVVDDADVYVTLAASDLGVWNPFSWYPYTPPAKWAAIVTSASDVSAVATLVDRGYGWVYVTSEAGFETKSTIVMSDLLSAIETPTTRRKLQERNLEASAPYWGCDDTLFECKPICLKKTGVTTTKVSDHA